MARAYERDPAELKDLGHHIGRLTDRGNLGLTLKRKVTRTLSLEHGLQGVKLQPKYVRIENADMAFA